MNKVRQHNKEVIFQAEQRAGEMMAFPSKLEEMMKLILDTHHIVYQFQKIFYIHAQDGWITRYYIADFFVPHKNLIIEVDGAGENYRIMWGLVNGGKPTSELPSHLMNHEVKKRVTIILAVISALFLFTAGSGLALIGALVTWAVNAILDYGISLQRQYDETL